MFETLHVCLLTESVFQDQSHETDRVRALKPRQNCPKAEKGLPGTGVKFV